MTTMTTPRYTVYAIEGGHINCWTKKEVALVKKRMGDVYHSTWDHQKGEAVEVRKP